MLIRLVLKNILSFHEQREFSLIPNVRLKTLQDHIYQLGDVSVLKLSSIYGANGAGKSNLIHGIGLLQKAVTHESIPNMLKNGQFKFQKDHKNSKQIIAVEFFNKGKVFYYGIEIQDGIVITEELYESGLGQRPDSLVFERKQTKEGKPKLTFSTHFEKNAKNKIFKEIVLQEFIHPNKLLLKFLSNRDNKDLQLAKTAYEWFNDVLTIINPNSKVMALPQLLEQDKAFKSYADQILCSFNVGITGMNVKKETMEAFFGEDDADTIEKLKTKVDESPTHMVSLKLKNNSEVNIVKEKGEYWVKKLQLKHKGNNKTAIFELDEESDGTIRLLDFIPAFKDLTSTRKVFIIDEIERSLHPLLVKELIKKFSDDPDTQGQLIFSTHESNLLDQDIFRLDEIWFAEKDTNGSTDIYSLNAFKEHKTIDIQKGYLNGRYGSIPFLGNLKDLNWHNHVVEEQEF